MGVDLNRVLNDAAERGTTHRPDLDPGPVLQRIRRRRTARVVTHSAVGVAAASAVAVGGLQLADRRSTPPAGPAPSTAAPVTPRPTVTTPAPPTPTSPVPTTPAPTPAPSTPPTAYAPLPACGAGTAGLVATVGPVTAETWAQVGVVDALEDEFLPEGFGDQLLVGSSLLDPDRVVDDVLETGAAVIARDGVVVATYADATWTADPRTDVPAGTVAYAERLLDLDACDTAATGGSGDAGATADRYLGAGDYVLWVASVVSTPDGVAEVVHRPVPFTVFEFEDPDNPGVVRWTAEGAVPAGR